MFSSKQQNAGASRSRHRSVSPGAVRITIPHTPQLSTRGRRRPVAVFSREEQEQKARKFEAKGVGETGTKFIEGIAKKGISATDWLRI